jgi:hypothetical protein
MSNLPTKLQIRIDAMLAKRSLVAPNFVEIIDTYADEVKSSNALPLLSNTKRAVPNAILRSSLFGVIKKGHRNYEQNVLKATVQGLTITFTGPKLDQADLDVYLECVRRCASHPLGDLVRFTAYDFLKSINRDHGNTQYAWLKAGLLRLMGSIVDIGDGRFFYTGHLLNEKYRDEKTGEFVIALNPKIAVFFSGDVWTRLSQTERNTLKGKPLAQWLHGFYSSHKNPYPYKSETIKDLCGSESTLVEFRRMLKKSLSALSAATGWQCWVDQNDLVNVKKKSIM